MLIFSKELIPTEDNPHPLLKLTGSERDKFAIQSFAFTLLTIVVLYVIPNLYWLEVLTTNTSLFFLETFNFRPRYFVYEDSLDALPAFDLLMYTAGDSIRATYPSISIETGAVPNHYLIVKACTGMQAGALLLGLIWSTPSKTGDQIRASYLILIALFLGNTLRIASMIAITTILTVDFNLPYDPSWDYAHNIMGRPLGFFGTIGFVAIIEKSGVKLLDTITVWIDSLMYNINRVFDKIFPKKK